MRKQTGIFIFCMAAGLLICSHRSAAQNTYKDLQKLELNSSQAIIPVPTGGALQGKGLDSWMNGLGPGGEAGVIRGFSGSTKTEEQKFFALGSLYTALLVQAGSSSTVEAGKAIGDFRQALTQLQAPSGFFGYLSELELMTKSRVANAAVAARMAGAIQGFVSDFVHSRGDTAFLNYRAGQWATTLALAAHAHDAAGLQLSAATYFQEKYATQHPSNQTLAALKGLAELGGKEKLDDADFVKIENLAEQLRDQLS